MCWFVKLQTSEILKENNMEGLILLAVFSPIILAFIAFMFTLVELLSSTTNVAISLVDRYSKD